MLLLTLLFSAAPPKPAFVLYDEAKLFSKKAAEGAGKRLKALAAEHDARSLTLVVESAPPRQWSWWSWGPQSAKEWARQVAEKRQPSGPCVFVVFSKEPPDVGAIAWPDDAALKDRIKSGDLVPARVRRAAAAALKDGFDAALKAAVGEVESAVKRLSHLPPLVLRDEAKLFSPRAAEEATRRLDALRDKHRDEFVPLVVETVQSRPALRGPDGPHEGEALHDALQDWARGQAKKANPEGPCLFAVFSKEPKDVVVVAWPGEEGKKAAANPVRLPAYHIGQKARAALKEGFDAALGAMEKEVESAVAGPSTVVPFDLHDGAGLFDGKKGEAAAQEARKRLKSLQEKYRNQFLPLVVETAAKGPDLPEDEEARRKALGKWAREMAENRGPDSPCLFVIFSKEPRAVGVAAWPSEAEVNALVYPSQVLLSRAYRKISSRLDAGWDVALRRAVDQDEWAIKGPVRDTAKLFSPKAVAQITRRLARLEKEYGDRYIEFIVETVEEQKDLSNLQGVFNYPRRNAELERWARGRAAGPDKDDQRVFVLISKEPPDIRVVAWPDETGLKVQGHLLGRIRRAMGQRMGSDRDSALKQGVDEFERILDDIQDRQGPLQTLSLLAALGVLVGAWVVLGIVCRVVAPSLPTRYPPVAQGAIFGNPASLWVVDRLLASEQPAAPPAAPAPPPSLPPPPAAPEGPKA